MTDTRLTDLDRLHIDQARALAEPVDYNALRAHLTDRGLIEFGELDGRDPSAFAFGVARSLLRELADLAERLAAD